MYIQWGYSQSKTSIHIAGNDTPTIQPGRYGCFKHTLCGKEYEVDDAEKISNEAYAKAHLCKKCRKIQEQHMSNITAIKQIQSELERAAKLQTSDPAMDWKAYQALRNASLAITPLLPSEVAALLSRLVGVIDETYAGIGEE